MLLPTRSTRNLLTTDGSPYYSCASISVATVSFVFGHPGDPNHMLLLLLLRRQLLCVVRADYRPIKPVAVLCWCARPPSSANACDLVQQLDFLAARQVTVFE